jgi:2-amino-4-hydroxy-6-hydroxymethyldihydropteridine diphosphokinase
VAETAYIGLGSNLGDSMGTLRVALAQVARMDGVCLINTSGAWETTPVGPIEQDNYLNAAAAVRTEITPGDLLNALLDLERQHGRERLLRWGPRTLDLDILLYGDLLLEEPGLKIPHPWLSRRRFVLEPLLEIAPKLMHPGQRKPLAYSLEKLRRENDEQVRRVADLAPDFSE